MRGCVLHGTVQAEADLVYQETNTGEFGSAVQFTSDDWSLLMVTVVFWTLGIINGFLWLINGGVAMSSDRSGSGMVLMVMLPFSLIVGLVSLVIIGFLT